jgi:hypothetical protein
MSEGNARCTTHRKVRHCRSDLYMHGDGLETMTANFFWCCCCPGQNAFEVLTLGRPSGARHGTRHGQRLAAVTAAAADLVCTWAMLTWLLLRLPQSNICTATGFHSES